MRRTLALTPHAAGYHIEMVSVLLAAGHDDDEARAEIRIMQDASAHDEAMQAAAALTEIDRASWFGAFTDAKKAFDGLPEVLPASEKMQRLMGVDGISARLPLAEETGEDATALLKRYVAQRATTASVSREDAVVLAALVHHQVLSPADVSHLKDKWRAEAVAGGGWPSWQVILTFDAPLASTPAAAKAVLSRPELAELPARIYPFDALTLGRLFVLAGRAADARPHLANASSACTAMDAGFSNSASTVRASLELGRVGETLGDAPAACAAYRRVLDRWGRATPRSLTVEAAREARQRLDCPP